MSDSTAAKRRAPRLDRRAWLGLAGAAVVGLVVAEGLQRLPPRAIRLGDTPVVRAVLEDAGSPRIGPAGASVTVVVFTDYRCAVCRRTDPALDALVSADPDVRVIYKDWPILGAASREAAAAALAARAQGRYLAFHRRLMAAPARLDGDHIRRAAREAGVDWPRLLRDRAATAAAIEAQLDRHALQAWSLGLEGTPGYLVGPYLVRGGLDGPALARWVRKARAAGPPL